jgi:hypothetical protein
MLTLWAAVAAERLGPLVCSNSAAATRFVSGSATK